MHASSSCATCSRRASTVGKCVTSCLFLQVMQQAKSRLSVSTRHAHESCGLEAGTVQLNFMPAAVLIASLLDF